eukprot:158657_1
MEKFRDTIQSAIIKNASLLIDDHDEEQSDFDDHIALLICEYSGYTDFISYKWNYPPNKHPFDTRVSSCTPFGFLAGQRVFTIDGEAICIGVAPSQDDAPQDALYFDLFNRNTTKWIRLCYPLWKREQFMDKGFALLDGFINIWGQGFHTFKLTDTEWWRDEQYAIGNPLSMPTTIPPMASMAPIPTAPIHIITEESDLSLWYWSGPKLDLSKLDKYQNTYDEDTCTRIDGLDIGRSWIYSNHHTKRVYLIIKTATDSGYQVNMDSRYVRRILKGTAVQRLQNEHNTPLTKSNITNDDESVMIHHKTNLSWFWEGDEPNLNVWNKYDEDTAKLINNHTNASYGNAIPYLTSHVSADHKFKYELIRLSTKEGIQRNPHSGFSRRIVREDHEDIDVDHMLSTEEYNAKLKEELRPKEEDEEEKYEQNNDPEPVLTSNIAALATQSSVPLTPKTIAKEKEEIKRQTDKQYKGYKQKPKVIEPKPDKQEDVIKVKEKKRTWRWTKAFMFTGYVLSRALSLTDLTTDLILLYKAQLNNVILLTIALFISIFSPYVLSYSSGIKLFIFRKTFDHLQGFKKIFLLLYLLPSGFLYFIFIDIIDSLFTVYKWFMYNMLCREEKDIKETEELLAQQLGMDRMNWEGFKRQKTVGQLMFETIPQVILQGLIAFDVGGALLELEGTTISKRDLYLSVGSAVINSMGQITKLYLESIAVQESFIQYALTCMMGRVGWVPFRHKIQRIFTNKNINTSAKQNANNTILTISDSERQLTKEQGIANPLSDLEVIDFNIKYNIPILSTVAELLGFKHKLQGTIEYDFSTVTIRYLIATLLVLHNASSDDSENSNRKNKSIQIQFGQSLRLLGVHDIALLLETCHQKNIKLDNVKDIVTWVHAFETSTVKERKDPRLVSYSRDEQGRPLLIGLYLSTYDPDKQILRALLRNDVPINLEDASGETIVFHLIRHLDYPGIRELFKTKYEKDEKRSNIYLNVYNRSGYSPLYLALHQHMLELAQKDAEEQKDNDSEDDDSFVIDEPAPKAPSKVRFTDTKQTKEQKEEEEPLIRNDTKEEAKEEESMNEIEMAASAPIQMSVNAEIEVPKKKRKKKRLPKTVAPLAPMAPMAPAKSEPLTTGDDAFPTRTSHSEPKLISTMTPLSMLESVKVQKYTKMWKDGQDIKVIEAKMESNGIDTTLLHRYIHNKTGKKSRKKKKKKLHKAVSQELNLSSARNADRKRIEQTLSKKLSKRPSPMQRTISDQTKGASYSTVSERTKQLDQRQHKLRRKEQKKQQKIKQKNINNSLEENLIELAKTKRFASETIMNTLRFKWHDMLWNNLMTLFENYEMIRCVYACVEACDGMIISSQCTALNGYVKMAKLGSTLVQIETKMAKDKYLKQQQRHAFSTAYKCIETVNERKDEDVEQLPIKNTSKPIKANDPRLTEYLNMLSVGVAPFGVIQHMQKMRADRSLIEHIERMHAQEDEEVTFKWQHGRDVEIVRKAAEKLWKRRKRSKSRNQYEIFKIIPRIMDAQHMMKLEHQDNSLKQFIKQGSMQIHTVMHYIKQFEQHCNIDTLKDGLNLKLSSPELEAFAPLTGSYKEYLFEQQKDGLTLAELMKMIQQKELEKINAKLVSFAYDNLRGYYLDYFADKEDGSDDDDEDILDAFNDRQWMYQVLLSHNSDPNFECTSGGLSPLAYALTNLFEHIYVANDLVTRGAKLQAKETHIMVNIFVDAAFEAKAELYLDICVRICRKSDIHLSNIRDQNGNNPIHLSVLRTGDTEQQKEKKTKGVSHTFARQKEKALKLLNATHPKWLTQKNKKEMYPLTIAVKFRDLDSTMCLGSILARSLQQKMKCIVSHRAFVMDLIMWVVTVLLSARTSDIWDQGNYCKLMEIELLFGVFDYAVSFQWPSSYIKTSEIIHFDEFQKENLDLASFSLISYCYEKRFYSILELLTTEFSILQYLTADEHIKVKEMELEIKQFTGQMFKESRAKFETKWEENILDRIRDDMLLENDFGSPDLADVASKFVTDDDGSNQYDNDENAIDDQHSSKKKAVSWIEVIYSTTVEGLSTADFITDILILRDLWISNNLWWTTFMLSLLIAPYLVCYSALGSLIQHRMNFIYLTMSVDAVQCAKQCKWFSFNFLVLLLMTPLCIAYFVLIDIVFMVYVMVATFVFFISCTQWDIGDVMDDWVFKKIFGLNRMQIIGYRRLRTLSQLFFETIPQIFLQLRILWQIEWAGRENDFAINSEAIMWSVGFAVLHLIFEAAIISLDSAASKMKFIHYAIVCLGARLDWIPFSHLFSKKARQIQAVIDCKDYAQAIDIKQEYFESEDDNMRPQVDDNCKFNYEEIAAGLCGMRYKLEFQFSNESMNKLAETLTYLASPTLPTNHTSNRLLKSLLNSVLLEPLMMEVILGTESCRNVDIFAVAELYRSTVHRVHLNMTDIDMYRVIRNSHISTTNSKMMSLLMEEFINYGELSVVEWLCPITNRNTQSIKSWIILNSLGGVNGIQLVDASNSLSIEGGKFEILRKYYSEGLVFGLDCALAKLIYQYVFACLQRAVQEHSYFYVAVFILWYTRRNIYDHCCSLGCCKVKQELQSIQSNRKAIANNKMHKQSGNYIESLMDKLHKHVPQVLEVADWEMSFRLTECFAVFRVHLEELLLNQLKDSARLMENKLIQTTQKKKKKKKGKRFNMGRVATTMDFGKSASHILDINDEYTHRVLGLDFYELCRDIRQSDIDLLQAIIDTSIPKLHSFPLHSFFVPKLEALDVLVTQLRMTSEYHKYLVATTKYRNKDVCYMGENGTIIGDLHLTHGSGVQTIDIRMTELKRFLSIMHLGIVRLRLNLKNVQSSFADEDEKKSNKKDIGHVKLWWINPIEACDKKRSTQSIETLQWNRVYLADRGITFKMMNEACFDVSNVFGLCLYNRRLMDYGKIEGLHLELSVHEGQSLHCDGIELEIEFIKRGMRKISVKDEEKPIHRFCKNNSVTLLKYMVPTFVEDRTFAINAMMKKTNETPLHVVCGNAVINYETVALLIENGIEINKQNKDEDTALDIIQKKKNKNPNINHNVEQFLIKKKAIFNTQKPKKTNDPRLTEYLNMLKFGVPIWAVIQYMKKNGADRGLIQDIERTQVAEEAGNKK